MKKLTVAFLMLSLSGNLWAQRAGSLGAGVVAGDPTGLTIKYWLDDTRAFDAGVGFSGDAAIYGDLLFHGWDIFPQPERGRLGAYVGIGPRIETERETALGIRTMGGVDYWIANRPIEIFLEAGPVFRLSPNRDVDLDAGLGVRFYFGGSKTQASSTPAAKAVPEGVGDGALRGTAPAANERASAENRPIVPR